MSRKQFTKKHQKALGLAAIAIALIVMGLIGWRIGVPLVKFASEPEKGSLLCIAASTLGSVMVFLLVRRFGVPLAEVFFPPEKLSRIRFLKTTPKRNLIFLIIFMIPGTPKDLLCYFAGLTDMKFSLWLIICSLGRLPSIVTSTVGGDALGTSNYWLAGGVFAATFVISVAGLWVYDRICKKHGGDQPHEDG